MKILKNTTFAITLMLISSITFAQENATITYVCSKNIQGATEVLFDLNGEVTTEFWNNDYAKVVIHIKANGASKEVIKHLMTQKRFNLSGYKSSQETYEISMPYIDLPAFINGNEFKEELSFQLFLPHYTLATRNTNLIAKNAKNPK